MKILILVLSYNNPPYDSLMRAQMETWDSVIVPGVKTVYYHGGEVIDPVDRHPYYTTVYDGPNESSKRLGYQITDSYYYMAGKFKECLKDVLMPVKGVGDADCDLIFRTNSSSYVQKHRLIEFAQNLPKEKLYAGWTFEDSNFDGGACVSGAGIWLSRDCAEILLNEIDPKEEIEEDVYIGRILRKDGIVAIDDKSRIDYPQQYNRLGENPYHIRLKTSDRLQDARNMIELHKKLIK